MKKYSSQALAIVLVLLVVGSIVGFALYARMIRESERVVEERSSAEANELAETVVGLISTLDYGQIRNDAVLERLDCDDITDPVCRKHDLKISELTEILEVMGLDGEKVDFTSFVPDLDEEFCSAELAMYTLSDEGMRIEKDEVYSIFVRGISWDDCEMSFQMDAQESGTLGFVMSTFYGNYDENNNLNSYKPYEFDDIVGFKYESSDRNWIRYSSGEYLTFSDSNGENYSFKKDFEGKNYLLDEVRFKSLGGVSNLSWNIWGNCKVGDHLLVEIGAVCGGQYVGKSFVIPEASFSPPMFDYVYFQGQGDLIL